MWYPFCLAACVIAASSCGADAVESDFSKTTSQAIFDASNSELHALHLAGLELEEWPSTYSWDCAGGGSIDMLTVYDGEVLLENIDKLEHTLRDCVLDGRTLNGTMNYNDFRFVLCGSADGVAFDIEATLEVTGPDEGSCVMDAREDCGEVSGRTCGHDS